MFGGSRCDARVAIARQNAVTQGKRSYMPSDLFIVVWPAPARNLAKTIVQFGENNPKLPFFVLVQPSIITMILMDFYLDSAIVFWC